MSKNLLTLGGALVVGVAAAMLVRRAAARRESFAGRTVVITGGSRGLGLALAWRFGREGARLVLLARSREALDLAAEQLRGDGISVQTIACDVRNRDDVRDTIDFIVADQGQIDVLVNNAGIIQVAPFLNAQVRDFEDSLNTHFWGPYFLIDACLPHLRKTQGRVVNISSIGGRMGVPHLAPYCVGKFALAGFSDTLHAELAPLGVSVTTVTPYLMRTGSHRNVLVRGQQQKEATWFALSSATPLTAISAEHAARQIVEATRRRRARIAPGWPSRIAEIGQALAPELASAISVTAVRTLLPAADVARGNEGTVSRDLDLGRIARWFATSAAATLNQTIPADERR